MVGRRITVVGAGPAGLIAALAGRRLGLDVRVHEQAPDFRRIGGGIMIHPNGLRVLDALDLLDGFRPFMRLTTNGRLLTTEGRCLSASNLSELNGPLDQTAVVLRYQLQEYLLAEAQRAGIPVVFGSGLTGMEVEEGGASLRFSDGDRTSDVVIAADGVHSTVREALGIPARKVEIGEAYLRLVSDTPTETSEVREIWANDGRRFGICPLVGGKTYCFCTAPLGRWNDVLAGGVSGWIESWSDFGPEVRRLLDGVPDWRRVNYSELHEVRMKRRHRPPAFLVGDAAHAMTPNLGQGANSAMVDSLVLMKLLAECRRDSLEVAARRHDAIRGRFTTKVQTASRRLGNLARPMPRPARVMRNALIRLSDRVPPMRRSMLRTFAGFNPAEQAFFSR